jgi:hypothetical protein
MDTINNRFFVYSGKDRIVASDGKPAALWKSSGTASLSKPILQQLKAYYNEKR